MRMFDFLKDLYLERSGLDLEKVNEERKRIEEEKKKNRYIFSSGVKKMIIIFGLFYLIISFYGIYTLIKSGNINLIFYKFIVLSIIDICGIINLYVNRKKNEILALICVILFFVINISSAMI